MSSSLIWEIVKNRHAFLHRAGHGHSFSSEPGNTLAVNSRTYTGIGHCSPVDVQSGKGFTTVFTHMKAGKRTKPAKALARQTIGRHSWMKTSKVAKNLARACCCPRVQKAAVRRAAAIHQSHIRIVAKADRAAAKAKKAAKAAAPAAEAK